MHTKFCRKSGLFFTNICRGKQYDTTVHFYR